MDWKTNRNFYTHTLRNGVILNDREWLNEISNDIHRGAFLQQSTGPLAWVYGHWKNVGMKPI